MHWIYCSQCVKKENERKPESGHKAIVIPLLLNRWIGPFQPLPLSTFLSGMKIPLIHFNNLLQKYHV